MKQPRGFPGLAVRCLLILLALAACGSPATAPEATTAARQTQATATTDAAAACRQLAASYGDEMEPIVEEWDDAVKLAGQTSRGQLATQISALQAIRRKADDVTPPACAEKAHSHLISSMNNTVDGFLAFMGQKSEAAFFATAAEEQQAYLDELLLATTPPELLPTPAPPIATPEPNEIGNLEYDLFQAADLPKVDFMASDVQSDLAGVVKVFARSLKIKANGRDGGFITAYVFDSQDAAQAAADKLRRELPGKPLQITDLGDMAYSTLGEAGGDHMVLWRCFVVIRISVKGGAGIVTDYGGPVDRRLKAGSFCK